MSHSTFDIWRWAALPVAATATVLAFTTGALATEQAQQRQEGRKANQGAKQEARSGKIDCRQENNKSNSECRQDKRDAKQSGRQEKRDIKY